jgi:hypothetical protein
MNAREKLNFAYLNGSLLIAGVAGYLTGSWLVFGVTPIKPLAGRSLLPGPPREGRSPFGEPHEHTERVVPLSRCHQPP